MKRLCLVLIQLILMALPLGANSWTYEAERAIFDGINEVRVDNGRSALSWNSELAAVSRGHSQDMAVRGYFAHKSPEGAPPHRRIMRAGISCQRSGENIFLIRGDISDYTIYEIAEQVVEGWWNSPGHKSIMLTRSFDEGGVGIYQGDEGLYVTFNGIQSGIIGGCGGCLF